jgi:hypothetical protein
VTTNQPSTADYGLALPSEAEVIADLVKLVGTDVAIVALRDALESGGNAGRPRGNQQDVLLHIAERLAARPDVAGVFGRSLAVRVRTYTAVSNARRST